MPVQVDDPGSRRELPDRESLVARANLKPEVHGPLGAQGGRRPSLLARHGGCQWPQPRHGRCTDNNKTASSLGAVKKEGRLGARREVTTSTGRLAGVPLLQTGHRGGPMIGVITSSLSVMARAPATLDMIRVAGSY